MKDVISLARKKLGSRLSKCSGESANVVDIKDLMGGRINCYNWQDLERLQSVITLSFDVKERSQLPKRGMDITQRSRGYSGLFFYIIWQHFLEKPHSDLVLDPGDVAFYVEVYRNKTRYCL